MGVGEKFAEGGLAVHDGFPGDEFAGALVKCGFSEEGALVGATVPLGVGSYLKGAPEF